MMQRACFGKLCSCVVPTPAALQCYPPDVACCSAEDVHRCVCPLACLQAAANKGEWPKRPIVDSWAGAAGNSCTPPAIRAHSDAAALLSNRTASLPVRQVFCISSSLLFPATHYCILSAVEEKGGFVWLFFGSKNLPADARPPIPYCDELGEHAASLRLAGRAACAAAVDC